jgi:hypothetical protein
MLRWLGAFCSPNPRHPNRSQSLQARGGHIVCAFQLRFALRMTDTLS